MKTTEPRASSGRISVPRPMTTAAGTARRRRSSSRTSRRNEAPSHRKTIDISSPEVANSHTPATTDTISRPSGNTGRAGPRAGQALDRPTAGEEPGAGADQAEDHRQPLERHEGQDLVEDDQGEQPQGVRIHLDPLTEVEDQAVPGQQVVDDPEVDEGVLVHPSVRPGPDQDDDHRDHHRPPAQRRSADAPARLASSSVATSRRRVGGLLGKAHRPGHSAATATAEGMRIDRTDRPGCR